MSPRCQHHSQGEIGHLVDSDSPVRQLCHQDVNIILQARLNI